MARTDRGAAALSCRSRVVDGAGRGDAESDHGVAAGHEADGIVPPKLRPLYMQSPSVAAGSICSVSADGG